MKTLLEFIDKNKIRVAIHHYKNGVYKIQLCRGEGWSYTISNLHWRNELPKVEDFLLELGEMILSIRYRPEIYYPIWREKPNEICGQKRTRELYHRCHKYDTVLNNFFNDCTLDNRYDEFLNIIEEELKCPIPI